MAKPKGPLAKFPHVLDVPLLTFPGIDPQTQYESLRVARLTARVAELEGILLTLIRRLVAFRRAQMPAPDTGELERLSAVTHAPMRTLRRGHD